MSEVDAKPPSTRGRSSHRGGRSGFGRGGTRGGSRKPANGTPSDPTQVEESLDDQGELGEMKKKFASELPLLKDMFPDWTDVDLVFALQEADGDLPSTVDRITQGNVSQFAEVKSAKDRARSKVKEQSAAAAAPEKPSTRGGRGRGGSESTRGGRARGSDRGRGASRGGRGGHATVNGAAKDAAASVPTAESTAWDDSTHSSAAGGSWDSQVQDGNKDIGDTGQSAWADVVTAENTPAAASEGAKSSLIPEGGPKKSWASMFAPKPAPVPAKKATVPQPPPAELAASGDVPPAPANQAEPLHPPSDFQEPELSVSEPSPIEPPRSSDGSELLLTPSKDPLTEENVEHLPDESNPPATVTVASTTGSNDPRNLTPLPTQQAPIARPPLGGYATSAHRATAMPGRSASFQRRVQEQQEAVVMPGHNAVDRAAVQFGSMGINGEPGPDVDEDREEPETRHAPQHSPPSQPRTSLPPVPRQTAAPLDPIMPETLPTPKQAPGLPPASLQNQQQMQEAVMAPGLPNEAPLSNQNYNQYSRYGQPVAMQQESGPQQQKPYDPFSHQALSSQYDSYGTHTQQAPHQQQPSQPGFGGLSSAPNDYSSYYTADHQRGAYSNYYAQNYGPQDARGHMGQGQQDTGMGQQRSTSGFGAAPNESAFASQVQQQAQSRFADATGSGHNTPNPPIGMQQSQQQTGLSAQQSQHSMPQAPSHQQQQQQSAYGAQPGFPYGHQYYNSPYPQAYQNQFGYNPQLGGYGGYANKHSGMYGSSHGYGLGPQSSSYEQHSASPANAGAGAFGQNQQSALRSASGMSSGLTGLEDYGRGSTQSHQQSSGFGAMNDPFGRSGSGFGAQSAYGQQSMATQEDSLKPFSDAKGGPSPALGQPGGRPGSATNSAGGTAQSGLPPPQSHQSGFGGGYPGFASQGQYGLGGLGTQQQHGQGSYGSYGTGGFNQTYGSYGTRGGWGSNYGAH